MRFYLYDIQSICQVKITRLQLRKVERLEILSYPRPWL